jgi:hypothetical protein
MKPDAEPAIMPRRWPEEMAPGFDWSRVGMGPELEPEEVGWVYGGADE